jgi:metal-responsive CopG/Arc/MetJ family transcriptional regulator
MTRRQTLIQLDDTRLAALDERAAASGRSRSDLIREAIDLLLGTGDAAAIDAAILEGYRKHPPGEFDAMARTATEASIRDEPW